MTLLIIVQSMFDTIAEISRFSFDKKKICHRVIRDAILLSFFNKLYSRISNIDI